MKYFIYNIIHIQVDLNQEGLPGEPRKYAEGMKPLALTFLITQSKALHNNSVQYNTIECNTIQYITLQYNTIECNTLYYNTIHYNTIQFITIQYNTIQHNTTQYNAIQYIRKTKSAKIIDTHIPNVHGYS